MSLSARHIWLLCLAALVGCHSAAEPTAELRTHGQRVHADCAITWLDDALPDLPRLTQFGESYDLVLLTAVWMHLDLAERGRAMPRVAARLAPAGLVIMSLRHGPVGRDGQITVETKTGGTAGCCIDNNRDFGFGAEPAKTEHQPKPRVRSHP